MVDIWGRSSGTTKDKTSIDIKEIIKIVKDEISKTINLASVDKNEVVLFQGQHGKLKTSNILIDDILVKNPAAANDSIAVFKQGKLSPGVIITKITKKLEEFDELFNNLYGNPRQQIDVPLSRIKNAVDGISLFRTEYDLHVAQYATLQRNFNIANNVIEKFFDKKNIRPGDVKTILPNIVEKINKIKIEHPVEQIKQISYVVDNGTYDWILGTQRLSINIPGAPVGFYRFSAASTELFNIICRSHEDVITSKGVGVLMFYLAPNITLEFSPANINIVRANIRWTLEYLGPE